MKSLKNVAIAKMERVEFGEAGPKMWVAIDFVQAKEIAPGSDVAERVRVHVLIEAPAHATLGDLEQAAVTAAIDRLQAVLLSFDHRGPAELLASATEAKLRISPL